MQSACAIYSESVVRKKRKQKDRDRKKALVPCKCLFCNGNLYSVKKRRRYQSVFRDNVSANSTSQEGQESDDQGQASAGDNYSGWSLDSSSSSFLNHPSPVSETSGASGRLQNSPYFCVFKEARLVKQKVWNEAENREWDWGETLKIRTVLFAYVIFVWIPHFSQPRAIPIG